MQKEIEVKFLGVDINEIRDRLIQNQATLKVPMRLMRRVTIKTPEMRTQNAFLRVRDEGHQVTMTYKQFESDTLDGCNELEVTVGDFDQTIELLKVLKFVNKTYQESKRETWILEGAEVVIDEWPWIKPYIEIEAACESTVRHVSQKLGFDWTHGVFGSVMKAYEAEYPHLLKSDFLLSDLPEVKFGDDIPALFIKG